MKPTFRSRVAADLEKFLAFRRALGFRYARAEFSLRQFDRFVVEHGAVAGPLHLDRLVAGWLASFHGCKPISVVHELGVIRQFCLYRRRHDPAGFVPGREWGAPSSVSTFLPYIFSDDEIRQLLRARTMPNSEFRGITRRTLLLVLYCTGLRIGEAVRLLLRDVDLRRRTFFVEQSKGRSRWVPFGVGLARELRRYLNRRRAVGSAAPTSPLLIQPDGVRVQSQVASLWVRNLLRQIGLKPMRGRIGPRPYDLRHTFAVHRLTHWYRRGVDLHARLPWLSAYMGHDNILGTEVYLTATPELLQLASRRFAKRFHRRQPSS